MEKACISYEKFETQAFLRFPLNEMCLGSLDAPNQVTFKRLWHGAEFCSSSKLFLNACLFFMNHTMHFSWQTPELDETDRCGLIERILRCICCQFFIVKRVR